MALQVGVCASNAAGDGAFSASAELIPPAAPTPLLVSAASATSLALAWAGPVSASCPVSDYDVRYRRSTDAAWTDHPFQGTGTSTTITGLATGTAYILGVRASNSAGASAWAESLGTPNEAPGKPARPTVEALGATSARAGWTPPSNRGTAITGYDVSYRRAGAAAAVVSAGAAARAATLSGLTTGRRYDVRVRVLGGGVHPTWSAFARRGSRGGGAAAAARHGQPSNRAFPPPLLNEGDRVRGKTVERCPDRQAKIAAPVLRPPLGRRGATKQDRLNQFPIRPRQRRIALVQARFGIGIDLPSSKAAARASR